MSSEMSTRLMTTPEGRTGSGGKSRHTFSILALVGRHRLTSD